MLGGVPLVIVQYPLHSEILPMRSVMVYRGTIDQTQLQLLSFIQLVRVFPSAIAASEYAWIVFQTIGDRQRKCAPLRQPLPPNCQTDQENGKTLGRRGRYRILQSARQ